MTRARHVTRGRSIRSVTGSNPAFEWTTASALRLLAVPSLRLAPVSAALGHA